MTEPAGYDVRVHIASSDVPLHPAAAPATQPARRVQTRLLNETVDDTNPVRPLLPDDGDRICAWVQVTGGDVYLCVSQSDASQATPAGSILPSANTGPWPVRGQGALWAAQVTAGKTCVISVSADYGSVTS